MTSKADIWKFLRLLPDWKRTSGDLDMIYLATGSYDYDGWYEHSGSPTIVLSAWEEDLVMRPGIDYYAHHADIFRLLGVRCEVTADEIACHFTEDSARAYQLLHILLHELGHHHYRITYGRGVSGGTEKYAEDYAIRCQRSIWRIYCEQFHFRPTNPT